MLVPTFIFSRTLALVSRGQRTLNSVTLRDTATQDTRVLRKFSHFQHERSFGKKEGGTETTPSLIESKDHNFCFYIFLLVNHNSCCGNLEYDFKKWVILIFWKKVEEKAEHMGCIHFWPRKATRSKKKTNTWLHKHACAYLGLFFSNPFFNFFFFFFTFHSLWILFM